MVSNKKTALAKKSTATTGEDSSVVAAEKTAEKIPGPPVVIVRRKEMVERIALSSGVKPNVIKSVLDTVLKEIGDALSNGEGLNLAPLGKVTVNRRKEIATGEVLICKIRRNNNVEKALDPIDQAAE